MPLCSPNLVDGLSLYATGDHIAETFGVEKAAFDYTEFHGILEQIRRSNDYAPSDRSTLFLSVDMSSAGQQRFLSAIERTPFAPEPIDFRDLYVSLPPGTSYESDKSDKRQSIGSFASRIAFVLGRLSRHETQSPHIIVVTHCFEVKSPLLDLLAICPGAKVGIAYFKDFLDRRWKDFGGNFKKDSKIDFFPLDGYSKQLFGIELSPSTEHSGRPNQQEKRPSLDY